MLGPILGVLSAASFALSNVFARRGVMGLSALQGIYITVIAGVPLFVVAAAVSGQLFRLTDLSWANHGLLAASGVTQYIIGRYSNYRAINALGANGSLPLLSLSVLVAVALGLLLLDERVTLLNGVGIALLIVAPLLMLQRTERRPEQVQQTVASTQAALADSAAGAAPRQTKKPGFTRRQAEGYFFGLLTALGYGTSAVMVRAAIGGTDMALGGALVSYVAAAAVLLAMLALPGWSLDFGRMPRGSMGWFGLGTFSSFAAHALRFVALGVAPVSVITPIGQTQAAFVVLFSFLLNRRTELFNFRTLLAIVLSMVGAVILVAEL